jgi:hypothetical protein
MRAFISRSADAPRVPAPHDLDEHLGRCPNASIRGPWSQQIELACRRWLFGLLAEREYRVMIQGAVFNDESRDRRGALLLKD